MSIFKDKTTEMPTWEDKPARVALDSTETLRLARLPGEQKVPYRGVESVVRPRRGHDY
jgi:hypothetical protein